MVEADLAEILNRVGIKRRAVPKKHGLQHRAVAALGRPWRIHLVNHQKQAPTGARQESRDWVGACGRQSFHQERCPDCSDPVKVFDGLHPTAEIKGAGVSVNLRPPELDQRSHGIAILKTKRVRARGILGIHGSVQPKTDSSARGPESSSTLEPEHLEVELKSVWEVDRC